MVRVDGVDKRFPKRRSWKETVLRPRRVEYQQALRNVSLQVPRGEFFGLLGRNGAGKTTLFKILATLIVPDGGRAYVDGMDVTASPLEVRRRVVPVVSQERSLYWRLTAWENLRLYASLNGFRGPEGERRVDQVLARVGLADTGTKQVGQFSTGMKQRLLLGRALLPDPDVLLLDEPTRSLDPVTARDFREFLREEVNERRGCTVLLATHDADEVRDLCDRVGILEEGRLLAAGSSDELISATMEASYRIVARKRVTEELEELGRRGFVANWRRDRSLEDGWQEIRVEVPGGRDGAAAALQALLDAGVEVASFARRELALAELIEVVVGEAPRDEGT